MSWSGVLLRLPKNVSIADLPKDWKVPAIGSLNELRAQFERMFPGQHHVDGQTCVTGETFWIEFNYRVRNEQSLVESIGIRSNADLGAMAMLKRACDLLDLRMVDCQTGEIADFSDNTEASMKEFAEWRDRVIRQTTDQDE